MNREILKPRRSLVSLIILALVVTCLPLVTPSCHTPTGRNAVLGGLGGAAIGGLIGGRRGAVAGAITGGLIGAIATPNESDHYYPHRPPKSAYQHY